MKTLNAAMIAAGLVLTSAVLQQAHADVVVIVSAESKVPALTVEQIARIFQGRSNSMTPMDIEKPSQARREFYEKVVGGEDARVRARWSRLIFTGKGAAPKELHSGAELVKAVAADPNAIGYVDRSFVNMTVKVIYTVK
jgi:ABC-type phosphate transport system substrate-binding protein